MSLSLPGLLVALWLLPPAIPQETKGSAEVFWSMGEEEAPYYFAVNVFFSTLEPGAEVDTDGEYGCWPASESLSCPRRRDCWTPRRTIGGPLSIGLLRHLT
jgi:hypothetical protein